MKANNRLKISWLECNTIESVKLIEANLKNLSKNPPINFKLKNYVCHYRLSYTEKL